MIDYSTETVTIDGIVESLDKYRGQVMLIVNTATECGFTGQFEGLEELYRDYRDAGLELLGFPCNQFGGQEPRIDAEISQFCKDYYNVSFPLYSKVAVNGDLAHPLFKQLTQLAPGVLGTAGIKWNFTKFLVDRHGQVIGRYAPATPPSWLRRDIEAALADMPRHVGLRV